MTAGYKFYSLDDGDNIVAVRACDCPSDADALLEADAVLQASACPAVEVWNGSRRVGILSRPAIPSS